MRLIDGDALEDRLQSLAYDDWNQGVTTSWADAYRECADMVYEQPTIEPEPKKGRWIKLDMHAHLADHKCTACGQECYVPTCMGEPIYDFCPNCGADMREGEADGQT